MGAENEAYSDTLAPMLAEDSDRPTNYRRGLQRVCIALVVIWDSLAAFILFTGLWQPWNNTVLNRGWSLIDPEFLTPGEVWQQHWRWVMIFLIVAPTLGYGLLFLVGPGYTVASNQGDRRYDG